MKLNITPETITHLHNTLRSVRFMQFGRKAYQHCNKDVNNVRAAWSQYQRDPLGYLASSPAELSREILALCQN